MSFELGHSLLVGVGADLPCTVRDARALAELLRDEEICAYPPAQVTLLTEAGARRADIIAALARLAGVDKDATVVIYFSGHGYQVKSAARDQYYLMPFGYDLGDLAATAISGKEFADAIDKIPARKILLLLDCCHAGGFARIKDVGGLSFEGELKSIEMPPEIKNQLGEGHGRIVIASSRSSEKSLAGKPYSVFTTALLEALRGKGAAEEDGFVRVLDLAMHARQQVPSLTRARQHPIADIKGQSDNFPVSYYAGGDAKPKAIPETLVWTPDERGEPSPPAPPPERGKRNYITIENLKRFSKLFLAALEEELRHTGIDDLLIPDGQPVEEIYDGWYFYFEAADSPLNRGFEGEPGFFFALRIIPTEAPAAERKAVARLYCVIETGCLVTPQGRPKAEVRKQLLAYLNRGIRGARKPATLDVGGIWLEIGARRITSFDSVTADAIAAMFANHIPVVENRVKTFLDGRHKPAAPRRSSNASKPKAKIPRTRE